MEVNICANITATGKKKDYYWYNNIVATIYMTYNSCFYTNINMDLVHKWFKIVNSNKV